MKATGCSEIQGINSILEQDRRAITLLADNLKKLEKILIQKEDNSKIDIITELSKDTYNYNWGLSEKSLCV